MTESSLAYAFKLIRPCINSKSTGYPYVRLYDFRHTFACNTILRWNAQGENVNEKLYVLSTYLGHVPPPGVRYQCGQFSVNLRQVPDQVNG